MAQYLQCFPISEISMKAIGSITWHSTIQLAGSRKKDRYARCNRRPWGELIRRGSRGSELGVSIVKLFVSAARYPPSLKLPTASHAGPANCFPPVEWDPEGSYILHHSQKTAPI